MIQIEVGDELIWKDGSISTVLSKDESTFYELTQFGFIYQQCIPEEGEQGFRKTGRNWKPLIFALLKLMQEQSEVN